MLDDPTDLPEEQSLIINEADAPVTFPQKNEIITHTSTGKHEIVSGSHDTLRLPIIVMHLTTKKYWNSINFI